MNKASDSTARTASDSGASDVPLTAPAPYVPPPLTADDYAAGIQAHVDATAKARGYYAALTRA